jgi:hypothetical protein
MITFGIITNGQNDDMISTVIVSIITQNIPQYEIIIVGNTTITHKSVKHVNFDESIKTNWITRKKNIVCEMATYDIIVLMHDYIKLCDDWYDGFIKFGTNFDICVTKMKTIDGNRFRDSTLFPYDLGYPYESRALLPYHYLITPKINKLMYISGAYYVIKKRTALEYPLNEMLCWGDGEDAELSKRLTDNSIFLQCNPYSTVQLLKYKSQCIWEYEMTADEYNNIERLTDTEIDVMNKISKLNIRNYIMSRTGVRL